MLRHIRSFVRRQSRMTISQKESLQIYLPVFGIDFSLKKIKLDKIFNNAFPLILDIGFGSGDSLINSALSNPNKNFLGIEVYLPGVGTCLSAAVKFNINNLRIIVYDAVDVIKYMIEDNILSLIQIFFPDPWPKIKHNKRRIIQLPFLDLISSKLVMNGILHIVTDSKSYVDHIFKIILLNDNFCYLEDYINLSEKRFCTKFEKKAQKLGNKIFDLFFLRKKV